MTCNSLRPFQPRALISRALVFSAFPCCSFFLFPALLFAVRISIEFSAFFPELRTPIARAQLTAIRLRRSRSLSLSLSSITLIDLFIDRTTTLRRWHDSNCTYKYVISCKFCAIEPFLHRVSFSLAAINDDSSRIYDGRRANVASSPLGSAYFRLIPTFRGVT